MTLHRTLRFTMGLCALLALLTGLLFSDICSAQRLVEMPEGPLYRVKGFPMSISCNVSGFKGPAQQEFAFSLYRLESPEKEIHVIHTAEADYTYAVFLARVRNKDIAVKRMSGSSVILQFASLRTEDAGTFECFTPNTDGTYFGTYSANTAVNVIEDTLVASYSGPASHSIVEGESLQLECHVSTQTFQHTHVSVTWFVNGPTQTKPIITLDRDLTIRPGSSFEDRYRSGLISIEKVEDTTYKLRISQAQQSDSGEIYCQADEWILDPSRQWMRIAYKNSTGSNVKVEALEVTPDEDSFISHIEVLPRDPQEGGMLEIHCKVEVQNLQASFFSMTWLKNKIEVAQIGPSGVVSVYGEYTGRQNKGELRAVKISNKVFVLTIQPITTEDQGKYQCRASQEERTDKGLFTKVRDETSPEEIVHITSKESSLAVVMTPQLVQVTEGETLHITCRVSGANGPMSVSWKHKKTSGSSFGDVMSLSTEGVMEDAGPLYQHRDIRTFRPNATDFTLEISDAAVSDSGTYMCTVTESKDNMGKGNSQSQQTVVSVNSIDSLVKVVLRSRDTNTVENSVITMLCSVSAPKVPLAVTWKFQPSNSLTQKDIICMLHTGAVSCGGEQRDYQLETQLHDSGTNFILKILRASKRQQGRYQCQIDAYQKGVQKTKKLSNELGVTVRRPESKMSVSIYRVSPWEIPVNSNSKVDCLVTLPTFNSSRFGVTWMHGDLTLLKMKPDGVMDLSTATLEMDQRISMMMTKKESFQLSIQQVRSTDKGLYHCLVEEWVQDPDGIWYQLKERNATIELVVTEKGHDFSLNKKVEHLLVTEGMMVSLGCSLHTAALKPIFQYSMSWFFERQDQQSHTNKLLTFNHDGRLQFHDSALQSRLRLMRPTIQDFQLSILHSVESDSGRYYCQVDQYQIDCSGKWELKASDKSGFSHVTVNSIENKLQVRKMRDNVSVTDLHAGFTVECEISSRSSEESVFQVTWSRRQGAELPLIIFTAKRDGTLHSEMNDMGLVFNRPSLNIYTLTVTNVVSSDSGHYQCQVQEWLQINTLIWRKVAEDQSGELYIHVESEDKPVTETFMLKESLTHLNTTEGEQVDLSCSINVDKWDHTFLYTFIWYVERTNSSSRNILLKHTFDGLLRYQSEDQQLKSRLQFSRPTNEQFHLIILNTVPADSGRYLCEVEQYQLRCEGEWGKSGLSQSRSTLVNVHSTENKLQVRKMRDNVSVTDLHAGFTVECDISSRSSEESVFQVTWSRRQGAELPLIIFTAKRDGTLHSGMNDMRLVFNRPSLNIYTLTVTNAVSSDSGHYECQVQEWLQINTLLWRKVAEDQSGERYIHVYEEGVTSENHSTGISLGICVTLIFILVMVIVMLLKTVQKMRTASKKQSENLWAENNPLKTVEDESKS